MYVYVGGYTFHPEELTHMITIPRKLLVRYTIEYWDFIYLNIMYYSCMYVRCIKYLILITRVCCTLHTGFDDVTGEVLTQREDDKPEVVRHRLHTYETTTKPLLEHYSNLKVPNTVVRVFSGNESNVIYPKVKSFLEGILI